MTGQSINNAVAVKEELLPYRLREHFLTTPEVVLFHALKQMTDDHYVIYAKVALNDIFFIVRPNENVHYFNKLFRKHVDFYYVIPNR